MLRPWGALGGDARVTYTQLVEQALHFVLLCVREAQLLQGLVGIRRNIDILELASLPHAYMFSRSRLRCDFLAEIGVQQGQSVIGYRHVHIESLQFT